MKDGAWHKTVHRFSLQKTRGENFAEKTGSELLTSADAEKKATADHGSQHGRTAVA